MGKTGFISDLQYFLKSYGAFVKIKNDNEFFIDSASGKAVSDWGHLHVYISVEKIKNLIATYHNGSDKDYSNLTLTKTDRGPKKSPLYSLTKTNDYGEEIASLIVIFNDAASSVAYDDVIYEDSE